MWDFYIWQYFLTSHCHYPVVKKNCLWRIYWQYHNTGQCDWLISIQQVSRMWCARHLQSSWRKASVSRKTCVPGAIIVELMFPSSRWFVQLSLPIAVQFHYPGLISSKFSLALLGARCSPHYVLVSCSLDKVGLQTRFPCSVPDILIVNCCIQREADLYYWFADGDYITTLDSSKFPTSSTTTNSSRPISSGSQTVRSNWLPFHIEIAVDPVTFSVTVTEVYLLVMLILYIFYSFTC